MELGQEEWAREQDAVWAGVALLGKTKYKTADD